MAASPTLYLIDGHAAFFRAYHAIRGGLRSAITNEPTGMVYGFTGMVTKLLQEQHPEYLAVVIDASGDRGTFRSQIYPEYKAHRDPPPEDFDPQVERCLEVCRRLRIPVFAVEEVEADDVIATIVHRVRREHPEVRIRIVSKDKDLGQLLDEHTTLFDAHTGVEIKVEDLFERKGVKPSQVVDMLALMGDSVDNVPGVPGVGPKTAAALITEFGSLEALLANLDRVTGKKRLSIEASRDLLPLSKRLVTLKDDCEVPFDLAQARVDLSTVDADGLMELLHQLGFGRLRDQVRDMLRGDATDPMPPEAFEAQRARQAIADATSPRRASAAGRPAGRTAGPEPVQAVPALDEATGTLFAAGGTASEQASADGVDWPSSEAWRAFERGAFVMLADDAALARFIAEARVAAAHGAPLALDTETDGLSTVRANLCGVSLSFGEGRAAFIPVRSPNPSAHLSIDAALAQLRPLLEDPTVPKVGHNLKFDLNVLRRHGVRVRGIVGDSMIASYLVDSTRSSHSLDALAESMLGHRCVPLSALIGRGRDARTFDTVPLDRATAYAAEDAEVAWRLHALLLPQVRTMGLEPLYRDVEMPLVEVLAELEWNGIRVDAVELERQRAGLEREIESLKRSIVEAAPRPFNPDSPKQLSEVLFRKPTDEPPGLGLPIVKRTKTGASTDVEVLERLASNPDVISELPSMIVQYRQLTKLVGTYLVALREAIEPIDGRVHASFHQTVAATGRLSSSDPNLQNIPIRTAMGREIRRAFVADEGHLLLAADYSQIELRLLAHLSGDEALREAFRRGDDIHRAVAAEVYGIDPASVSDEQRSAAKMVNFGIVYGITPYGLARRLGGGATVERAKRIIEDYKARFRGIDAFLAACIEQARSQGFVATILGRRRPVPQIHSRNPAERALGERIAINTVVQGSAADLIKEAMVDLHRVLTERHAGVRLLLQIHDELVLEIPFDQVDSVRDTVVSIMEHAMELSVPLRVDTGVGRNWFEA